VHQRQLLVEAYGVTDSDGCCVVFFCFPCALWKHYVFMHEIHAKETVKTPKQNKIVRFSEDPPVKYEADDLLPTMGPSLGSLEKTQQPEQLDDEDDEDDEDEEDEEDDEEEEKEPICYINGQPVYDHTSEKDLARIRGV